MDSVGADDSGAATTRTIPPFSKILRLRKTVQPTSRTVGTMSRVGIHVHFFQSNCSIFSWLAHLSMLSNHSRNRFHLPANSPQLRSSSRAPNKGFWLRHLSIDKPLPRLIFEFTNGHLLRHCHRHQLLPASPARAITCCNCSWVNTSNTATSQ